MRFTPPMKFRRASLLVIIALTLSITVPLITDSFSACKKDCSACIGTGRSSPVYLKIKTDMPAIHQSLCANCRMALSSYRYISGDISKTALIISVIEHPPEV